MKYYKNRDLKLLEREVQKSKNGCLKSTEYIINFFQPFIIKTSKNIFIPNMDENDIKQNLILYLLIAIKKYNNTNTFFWYAIKTMQNNIYSELKANKKITTNSIEYVSIVDNFSIDEFILAQEDYINLNYSLKKLNKKDYLILYKFYFEDYSYNKMIKYFQKSYMSLAVQKNRALNKLKNIFEQNNYRY